MKKKLLSILSVFLFAPAFILAYMILFGFGASINQCFAVFVLCVAGVTVLFSRDVSNE
jgi:hypothetical protein